MTAERIAQLRRLDQDEVDERDMAEALDEVERLQRENEALRAEHEALGTYKYGEPNVEIWNAYSAAAKVLAEKETK